MFGVVEVGNSVAIHCESFSYASSSSTRKQNGQHWQRARADGHTQCTRNDILQKVGAAVECRKHPCNVGATPMADRFDRTESDAESFWGVQCMGIKHGSIKRALRQAAI